MKNTSLQKSDVFTHLVLFVSSAILYLIVVVLEPELKIRSYVAGTAELLFYTLLATLLFFGEKNPRIYAGITVCLLLGIFFSLVRLRYL